VCVYVCVCVCVCVQLHDFLTTKTLNVRAVQ
jgi:hypothetical protein